MGHGGRSSVGLETFPSRPSLQTHKPRPRCSDSQRLQRLLIFFCASVWQAEPTNFEGMGFDWTEAPNPLPGTLTAKGWGLATQGPAHPRQACWLGVAPGQ